MHSASFVYFLLFDCSKRLTGRDLLKLQIGPVTQVGENSTADKRPSIPERKRDTDHPCRIKRLVCVTFMIDCSCLLLASKTRCCLGFDQALVD